MIVAVISKNSVNSKWVRLELDAAMVKHLAEEGAVRIIPLKVDSVEAPLFLRTICWVDFQKEGYSIGLGKLLRAISDGSN